MTFECDKKTFNSILNSPELTFVEKGVDSDNCSWFILDDNPEHIRFELYDNRRSFERRLFSSKFAVVCYSV